MTVADIEQIGEAQFPRARAAIAMREYRAAMLSEKNAQLRSEYAALWRATRARTKGLQIVDIHRVFQQTGLQPTVHQFPRLAICRADATWCHVRMRHDGGATFADWDFGWRTPGKQRSIVLPADTFARLARGWQGTQPQEKGKALVPMIPPAARPPFGLCGYHILWDAVWTVEPPKDPFLLKHIDGPLFTVLFHWDLTPLEQAVLRGRLR